ncbi:HalOD1 output domain-containing protein [Natribaculum luteum]|uniref:HalOD1 output domain-containing protein n=1 Tax=Natribaculum luteum TaxID=1586232 RepID=A0ABD5NYS5_9EURY|nr:HalOD1 output domain-containing protein [Natribaculum luteum]
MSDGTLLFEIVEALEKQGLGRNEYQLQRVIDVEALEQLVDSADPHTDLGIQFTDSEFRVLVTDSRVTVTRM